VRRAAPYLLYGVVTLACFHRFLLFGWTLYDVRTLEGYLGMPAPQKTGWFETHRPPADRGDTVLSLPMLHRLYGEGLHHGELRLWNPYLFCGYPLYNNLLLHPFYPPNLVLHALLPPRLAYDLNLLLHFFFSGASMFWLLRGSGRSDFAAWVGGLLWMLIGYNTFWFSTGTFMGASVFAPPALLGLRRGLESQSFKPLALGGLAMGMAILGSHGQHALHVLLFLSIWMAFTFVADRETRRFTLKAGALFIGCALGTGMAAILTQLDSVTNGFRAPGEDLELHYANPWMLPTYIANLALGKVCYAPDGLLRSEFTIYASMAGAGLALTGAILGFRDRWLRFLSIFALAALGVAFIRPLAELALQIPFLNLSMPARWVYVFGFCLTLLAAAGVDALARDPRRGTRILAVFGILATVSVATYTTQGAVIETLIGALLAAAWLAAVWKAPRWAPGLLAASIAFDLLPNFVFFNAHADPAVLDRKFAEIEDLRAREKEPWRAWGSLRVPESPRVVPTPWTVSIGANILALYGVENVLGYESIAPIGAVLLCAKTGSPHSILGSGRVLMLDNPESPLSRLSNLRYLVTPFKGYDPDKGSMLLREWGPDFVYDQKEALPRAYLAQNWALGDADVVEELILKRKNFDIRKKVVLETDVPPNVGFGGGTVSWMSRETDRLQLHVDAKADSILVLSDTHYPGWECELDGVKTPILRANINFRAVPVPAGSHEIVMRFRPVSARAGLLVSALAVVIILSYAARRKAI